MEPVLPSLKLHRGNFMAVCYVGVHQVKQNVQELNVILF